MYKIAPLILNSGKKTGGAGQIFIAQPDAIKEDLAGKLFILFEAKGKSADLSQIADFLVANLNYYYYENEKISLLGKMKDLKPENIFESALAKTNSEFWEWINNEKLSFNPLNASITAGIVLEQEIHFSSFGSNKIQLVFRKSGNYEIVDLLKNDTSSEGFSDKIFSSVVSGQLPADSSFILSNEAFSEYINDGDLKNIISKLPPISASEQLKNTLSASNSFVPFLAIIIKSAKMGSENREIAYSDSASAHASMNNLNHTEEKTERLLSPIGVINLRKRVKKASGFFEKFMPRPKRPELYPENDQANDSSKSPLISPISTGPQKIGISEPMRRRNNQNKNSGSWVSNVFKIGSSTIVGGIKNGSQIFGGSFWKSTPQKIKTWFLALNFKQKILTGILLIGSLILIFSLSSTGSLNKSREDKKVATAIITEVKEKENQIDSYLLYGNEEGAKIIAQKIESELASLNEKQKNTAEFTSVNSKFSSQLLKLQHLTKIEATEVFDFATRQPGANPESLYLKDFSLFAFDSTSKTSFLYDLKNSESVKNSISKLSSPIYGTSDKAGSVYLFSGQNIGKLNATENSLDFTPVTIPGNQSIIGFDTFVGKAYLLSSTDGQIYRYSVKDGKYQGSEARLKTPIGSEAISFTIDKQSDTSPIFVVKRNGEIQKYLNGDKQAFSSDSLLPITNGISKIILSGSNVYLIDKQEKRIVIFNLDAGKTRAKFKAQYQFTNLSELRDATISGNTAYLLSGSKIYRAELK
ncbi:MAG: hypothetical protein ACOYMB_05160 [Patescibacteria group bacterium]